MLKIGLTGSIGTGKTTVANQFAKLGIPVLSADEVSRDLLTSDPNIQQSILSHFGHTPLTASGEIDRKALRQIIFDNPDEKTWLETLLHPKIRDKLSSLSQSIDSPYIVLEIPLLIETLPNPLIDRILVVYSDEADQLSRICQRDNIPHTLAKKMIEQQLPQEEKIRMADDIVKNNGSLEDLKVKVQTLHQQYLDLASKA